MDEGGGDNSGLLVDGMWKMEGGGGVLQADRQEQGLSFRSGVCEILFSLELLYFKERTSYLFKQQNDLHPAADLQ